MEIITTMDKIKELKKHGYISGVKLGDKIREAVVNKFGINYAQYCGCSYPKKGDIDYVKLHNRLIVKAKKEVTAECIRMVSGNRYYYLASAADRWISEILEDEKFIERYKYNG